MKALILAAGYGTRLYPLVTDTPKPLLPVADKPLINHIVDKLKKLRDLNELIVVTNNKFYQNFLDWAQATQTSCSAKISIVNDGTMTPETRLGSVGDIDFVIKNKKIDDDFFVLGGDNLFDYALDGYVAFAQAKTPFVSLGLYDIHNLKDATMYGVAQMDTDGKILSFEEKPAQPKSTLIAMCCYYFPRETVGYLAEYVCVSKKMDKAGDYIRWLSEEKGVYGFKFTGKWYDIGSIESYHEAQEKFR